MLCFIIRFLFFKLLYYYITLFFVLHYFITMVSTEVTFGRGDLSVCPLRGLTGAHECLVSTWRGVPKGSPQGQTLRALLLRGTSVLQ